MLVQKTNFSIVRMVRLLAVSRSGCYAWLGCSPSERAVRRENIEQKVAWFHSDLDEVYGSPQILADLRADGEIISRKTVAPTMRRLGLVGISPKRWRTTTVSHAEDAYPVNAVKRQWDTGALNQVWVGDITYLRTWEGWLYLATVIDADSDRGTQYASAQITAFEKAHHITRSMGYTGVCWDNAMADSFFATLKTEFYHRRVRPSKNTATREVGAWIADRYNWRRRHTSLNQVSPVDFEMQYSNQNAVFAKAV